MFETVVNKSEAVRDTKREKGEKLTEKQKRELTEEEKVEAEAAKSKPPLLITV